MCGGSVGLEVRWLSWWWRFGGSDGGGVVAQLEAGVVAQLEAGVVAQLVDTKKFSESKEILDFWLFLVLKNMDCI